MDSFTQKDCICHSKAKVRGKQEHPCGNHHEDDEDGGPEGDEVVLHEGEDLGVKLWVARQHLQRLIDKPATVIT